MAYCKVRPNPLEAVLHDIKSYKKYKGQPYRPQLQQQDRIYWSSELERRSLTTNGNQQIRKVSSFFKRLVQAIKTRRK